MAALQKLDSLLLYVSDIERTAEFYRLLGFRVKVLRPTFAEAWLGKFYLQFTTETHGSEFVKEKAAERKGMGMYIYVRTDDVAGYHKALIEKGITPSSGPRDWSWGNREFALRDPDGYKLIFYEELNK